jgi:putative transposase
MPRAPRNAPGGLVYHVLNRANGRLKLFKNDDDFLAFEKVLVLAHRRVPIRILAWCVMSTHWHFVLWPRRDGELSDFMRWLTLTHAQRWKHAHGAVGHGHLYQGRFKSFPIEKDEHLLLAIRYVERNPLAAKMVGRAERWRWGSCHVRQVRSHELKELLSAWPVPIPTRWLETVNSPLHETEAKRIKDCIERGRPLGEESWARRMASSLGLDQTLRPRGRPKGWRKRKKSRKTAQKG